MAEKVFEEGGDSGYREDTGRFGVERGWWLI